MTEQTEREAVACETCHYWVKPDERDEGFGKCQYARERWEVRNAPFEHPKKSRSEYDDWDEVDRIEEEALANQNAIVVDGSGYYAALLTKPKHFCSEHRKEPNNG